MIATFNAPVTLPWPYALVFGGSTPTLTVATFADLPASPAINQQVFVLDNGISSQAGVLWIDELSKWFVTITGCEFASLPVGGIWSVSPPVESLDFTTFAFDPNNSNGATYNDSTGDWRQLADITPVATFGDLPGGTLYQQAIVLDNGFGSSAFVVFDGTDWVVTTTLVFAFGDLPSDGVWNLSPSVISDQDTVVSDNSPPAIYWNWDGAAWIEYAIPVAPTVTVATFSLLPSDAVVGQRVAVTGETGLSGLVCINTGTNAWGVESVTCSLTLRIANQWGATPGRWYSSGGITVDTAAGAYVYDTTIKDVYRWSQTNTAYVLSEVYAGTIAGVKTISGAVSPPPDIDAGSLTPGGGTATMSTDGTLLTIAVTNPGSGAAAQALIKFTDTAITSTASVYTCGFFTIPTPTGTQAESAMLLHDGGAGVSAGLYSFGATRQAGATQTTGAWYNIGSLLAPYPATAAGSEVLATEKFVEMIHRSGMTVIRVGAGPWRALSSASVFTNSSTGYISPAYCRAEPSGATAATLSLRNFFSCRF